MLAQSAPPGRPQPIGSPGDWVTTPDYPLIPLLNGVTGTTAFKLVVDAKGTPSSCGIVTSSGNKDLDAQTCALLLERARFDPAKDAKGRPMVSTYTNRVRWTLPGEQEKPGANSREMTLDMELSSNGVVERCQLVEKDLMMFEDVDPCAEFLGETIAQPNANQAWPRLRLRMKTSFEFFPLTKP